VSLLLESTAGLSAEVQLGGPVEAWAKGKAWLVGHTVVAPSRATHGTLFHGHAGYTRYQVTSRVPVSIPATFSVVLGEGSEASAPVPYCAKSALPPDAALEWSSSSTSSCCLSMGMCVGAAARSEPLGRFENLTERAGSLPLAGVVGSSSAFLGGLVLSRLASRFTTVLGGIAPTWVSSARAGRAFEAAKALVVRIVDAARPAHADQLGALADLSVRALMDGAATDNTAIAQAVAAGASRVVAFQANVRGLHLLFQGAPLEALREELGASYDPVFAEQAEEVMERVRRFERLAVPEDNRILRGVTVGTLEVTTARCDPFGIEEGRRVQLHVLVVDSSLTLGHLRDFRDYAALLGQLVREFSADLAMPENSAAAGRLVELLLSDA